MADASQALSGYEGLALEQNAYHQRHSSSRESSRDAAQSDTANNSTNDMEKADRELPEAPIPPTEASADHDKDLVDWDGPEDAENPQNYSASKKWLITLLFSTCTVWVTLSSSIFSSATGVTSQEFHVSTEVTTLGVSFTVLGFAIGPLVWGPMSEVWGRRVPFFAGYAVFVIFQVPVAVAQNLQTVLVSRFFVGFFGTSSLAVVGGALADYFGPVDRAIAISIYAAASFVGPIFGPVIGGFVVESHLGWRWTAWLTMILAGFFGVVSYIFIPETYHPAILQARAARMRKETRHWAYHSRLDETKITARDILVKYLLRPCAMLFLEPILLCMTIYISLIYGILYLFFVAYPISFREVRGWHNLGIASLPLIAVLIGVIIGSLGVAWSTKVWYSRKIIKFGKASPEDRLPPMMVGAVFLPVGLFWFAWTSSPHISWIPQVISGAFIGIGIVIIWLQGLNYIIDVYLMFANSAISANTLVRSTVGAGFPLFATPMYHKLGVDWATSLLAFLSVAMIPIPIVFYLYGAKIRAMSKYTPKL